MDSAAAGNKPSTGSSNINDMKTILESIQSVEECGMEGSMPMDMPAQPEDKMSMNVTLSARGDAVEDLIKLMGGTSTPQTAPMPSPVAALPAPDTHDDEMGDMKKMMKLTGNLDMEEPDMEEPDMEEEWDNSPDEEYSDTKLMTKDLSGGINREKKAYAAAQDGDNAMAIESIKEQLWAALNEKFTNEGRGRGKKKAKEDVATEGRGKVNASRGRGKVNASRGRGKDKLMAGRGRGKKK